MDRPAPITRQEFVRHGLLLILPLVVLFPGVFRHDHVISAADQVAVMAPWIEHVPGYDQRPPKNSLTIDGLLQFNVFYHVAQDALRNGEWPLWNPLEYTGMPLLANAQTALFYPPRLLHSFMDIYVATTLYRLLKLWLCGMTAYLCGRSLGLGRPAARFLSLGWMLSSYTLIWPYHPLPDVGAWLPVIFMGVEYILSKAYRKGFFTTAIGATLILLAGHPETAFTLALGAGVYFLARLIWDRQGGGHMVRAMGAAGGAWVIALAICAVQLLPIVEYIAHSYDYLARETGDADMHILPPAAVVVFWVARFFGVFAEGTWWGSLGPAWDGLNSNWVNMIYPGVTVWVAVTLLRWRKGASDLTRARIACLAITCALLVPMAFNAPGFHWITSLPVFSSTHHVYFASFAMFALPLLGAMGVQRWLSGQRNVRELAPAAVLGGAAMILAVAISAMYWDDIRDAERGGYVVGQLLLTAAVFAGGIGILVAGSRLRRPNAWVAAFIVLLAVDLYLPAHALHPTIQRRYVLPETNLTNFLQRLDKPNRIRSKTAHIWEGALQPYGIEQWLGYDGLYPARVRQLADGLGDALWTHAEPLLSIGYYLTPEDELPEVMANQPEKFEHVDTFDHIDVYRNREALPRAFLAKHTEVVPSRQELFARMASPDFDPGHTVLVSEAVDDTLLSEAEGRAPPGDAEVLNRSTTSVTVAVNAERAAVLTVTDQFFPGWKAWIDGEPVEIFPAYHAFRGVIVPPGEHEVVFRYQPASFAWGMRISVVTLIGCAAYGLFALARRRLPRRRLASEPLFIIPEPVRVFHHRTQSFEPISLRALGGGRRLRELAIHGTLLIIPLAVLFPKTFLYGEMIAPGDQLLSQPPWSQYGRTDDQGNLVFAPKTNPLIFESLVTFHVNYTLSNDAIESGTWPLWNHLQYGGVPLLANGQSAVFYPVRLLHQFMDIPLATTLYILLKLWLCGMTAYLCARALSIGVGGARVTSVAWMLASYNLIWCYHPIPDVSVWLPIVFLGAELILRGRYGAGGAALGVGGTLILFAGHPETAFTGSLGVGFYFLIRLLWERRRGPALWRPIAVALGAWAVAVGVTAAQWLPTLEYVANSYDVFERPIWPDTTYYLSPGTALAMWAPRFFGTFAEDNYWGPWHGLNSNWVGMVYPGWAVWLGVMAAIATLRHRDVGARTVCLFITATLTLLLAYEAPILHFINTLPLLADAYQTYHITFGIFALALLAGISVDRWSASETRPNSFKTLLIGCAAIASIVGAGYFYYGDRIAELSVQSLVHRELLIAAVFAGLGLAAFYFASRRPMRRIWPVFIAVLLAADLIAATRGLRATIPRDFLFMETQLTNYLERVKQPARVGAYTAGIVPGYLQAYGIEQWAGYDGIYPLRPLRFVNALEDSKWVAAEPAYATGYYLNTSGTKPAFPVEEPGRFSKLTTLDTVEVWRNHGALPRAYLVGRARVFDDPEAMFDVMRTREFEPGATAFIESPIEGWSDSTAADLGEVTVTERTPLSVDLTVNAKQPTILALADTYYPGWKAYVGEDESAKEAEIFPVNYAFRGIVVPEGRHTVSFRYEPWTFRVGLAVSCITLTAACLGGLFMLIRRG